MLPMKKGILVFSIIMSSYSHAMHDKSLALSGGAIENITLHHCDDTGFNIEENGKLISVHPWFMDKELRGITSGKLARYLAAGAYLSATKLDNSDDYALRLKGRLNGGGPLFGAFCYGLIKAIGYGVPVVAGTTLAGAGATALAGKAIGSSVGIGVTAGQTAATAGFIQAGAAPTVFASTVVTGFEGLPVVGFVTNAVGVTTFTAAQAAQHAIAAEALMSGFPPLMANMAVSQTAGMAATGLASAVNGAPPAMAGIGIGKAIVATIGAEATGLAIAAASTAASGVAGYVSVVEGTATAVSAIATVCPFLP